MNANLIFDPYSVTIANPIIENNSKKAAERVALLIAEVIEKNRADGFPVPDCFRVCAIHRTKAIHRWFNLAPKYQGRVGHAEALLSPHWRIATKDERLACVQSDKLASDEERRRIANEEVANMNRTLHAIVKRADEVVREPQPLPAAEKIVEPVKQSVKKG